MIKRLFRQTNNHILKAKTHNIDVKQMFDSLSPYGNEIKSNNVDVKRLFDSLSPYGNEIKSNNIHIKTSAKNTLSHDYKKETYYINQKMYVDVAKAIYFKGMLRNMPLKKRGLIIKAPDFTLRTVFFLTRNIDDIYFPYGSLFFPYVFLFFPYVFFFFP